MPFLRTIIYINKNEMYSYDGPEVFLPISMPLVDYYEYGYSQMFSPKITPIFLGLCMAKDTLLPEEVAYFHRFEPIGCRDERTYHTLRTYGIQAYLCGCITSLLPRRGAQSVTANKAFIVDPPKEILPYIPEQIKKDAVILTHNVYGAMENPRQAAIDRYSQYYNEASLIITSLLHCSIPCMAFGIPVVLVKNCVSYRFAWVEALLDIFTPDQYDQIDWRPSPVQYDAFKQDLMRLTMARLRNEDAALAIPPVQDFLMRRTCKEYMIDAFYPLQQFIDTNWTDCKGYYRYAVWGLTQMSNMTVDYISKRYPNARLMHVYDKRVQTKLAGVASEAPEHIAAHPDEIVFTTSVGAAKAAEALFASLRWPKERYCLLPITQ